MWRVAASDSFVHPVSSSVHKDTLTRASDAASTILAMIISNKRTAHTPRDIILHQTFCIGGQNPTQGLYVAVGGNRCGGTAIYGGGIDGGGREDFSNSRISQLGDCTRHFAVNSHNPGESVSPYCFLYRHVQLRRFGCEKVSCI